VYKEENLLSLHPHTQCSLIFTINKTFNIWQLRMECKAELQLCSLTQGSHCKHMVRWTMHYYHLFQAEECYPTPFQSW